jgi:3-keto-5-aminohexanoate cleavage enzyme
MDKLIINAAITGMVPMKSDSPHIPITPDEIVADARRCQDAGATILHIHAREADGKPTYLKSMYAEIIGRIREECPELLLSGSTSGRVYGEFWQRAEVLDPAPGCRPDFGSLTLGSLNFPKQASINAPEMIQGLALAMLRLGIIPELEIFDLGMVDYAHYLIQKGILKPPYYGNILLGSLGTLSATPENLVTIVRALPPTMVWSATGIGRFQFFINALAVTMGGHVRIGLEDNLHYDTEKTELATNVRLIERVVKLAHAAGREIASPGDTRRILGIPANSAARQSHYSSPVP